MRRAAHHAGSIPPRPAAVLTGLAGLALFSVALAQEERKEAEIPPTKEYVDLPRITVEESRWRLPDEVKQELWRQGQSDRAALERETAKNANARDGAAFSTKLGKNDRMEFDLLPLYDPERAQTVDMQIDESRSEVVEAFRLRF